jgi:predicted TIM-barrel fold metal-dependent hydrolase
VATSKDSNNQLSQMTKTWPDRFAGLATLPMQAVKAAIAELERVDTDPRRKEANLWRNLERLLGL